MSEDPWSRSTTDRLSSSDAGDEVSADRSSAALRADRLSGIVLISLGLVVAFESWRMPRMSEFGASVWSAPGVVPGMIGLLLALMGTVLYARARNSLRKLDCSVDQAVAERVSGSWQRVSIAFILCMFFAVVLVGQLPFMWAVFLFIVSFIVLFDHNDRQFDRELAGQPQHLDSNWLFYLKRFALALLVAGIAAVAITWLFEDIFYVRLP